VKRRAGVVDDPVLSERWVTGAVEETRTLEAHLTKTLFALSGLPSTSGHEEKVRRYILARLQRLGVTPTCDAAGNVIARVSGVSGAGDAEPPLLLVAHMDRVPPGLAHTPVLEAGILRSDGSTNLGADDSAGIALILHIVEELRGRGLGHPPLVLLFTVGEEIGLVGAKAFDPLPWGAHAGIVFDNAGEAGILVVRAATYIAFDVTLRGIGGHPGKQFAGTASAVEMFRRARYPAGSLGHDTTRISIGRIEGGTARNAVPAEVRVQGEVRTLLEGEARTQILARIERAFVESAVAGGGSVEVAFDSHCDGYRVSAREPLVRAWGAVCRRRGQHALKMTTFIGSDASALRAHTPVFTISTGAMNEHTSEEWIATAPLAEIAETALTLLSSYCPRP
jgi:tripeptide aminopeptidase